MTQTLVASAVLFDMDGTLVDSTAMVEELWTEFAHANDVDPAAVIDFAHGRPSRATIDRFAADRTRVDEWFAWIASGEGERFDGTAALPGAVEVTRAIPRDRWALVTSALRGPALARIAAVGIPEPAVVVGADDVHHGKPHAEPYATAATALGVDPRQCIVFEDADAGVRAGRAAGCTVVVVGELATPATDGLARISDLSRVRVTIDEQITLDLA